MSDQSVSDQNLRSALQAGLTGQNEASVGSPIISPEDRTALANQFDTRAKRLRRQANILLTIIIFVLLAGATGFVFANDIASLNFHPQTAASQYAAAQAAWSKKHEEYTENLKRLNEIQNDWSAAAPVAKPFDDRIASVNEDFGKIEENQLA